MSDDLVKRLRQAVLDKDNFPRMDSERQVACGLAREAAAEIERLTLENWQLKGALGYAVPGDIPEGPFKCGLCEAKSIQLAALKTAGDEYSLVLVNYANTLAALATAREVTAEMCNRAEAELLRQYEHSNADEAKEFCEDIDVFDLLSAALAAMEPKT